ADTVHVLDHGTVVASGTPAALKARVGDQLIEITLAGRQSAATVAGHLADRLGLDPADGRADPDTGPLTVPAAGTPSPLPPPEAVRGARIDVTDIGLRHPTLDETFLALTGATKTPEPGR